MAVPESNDMGAKKMLIIAISDDLVCVSEDLLLGLLWKNTFRKVLKVYFCLYLHYFFISESSFTI